MTVGKRPETTREPYEKPQVRRVVLVNDELAAAGCKKVSTGRPDQCRRAQGNVVPRQLGS
jgi:hypothetical protein